MRSLVILIVCCLLYNIESKPLEGFSYNVTIIPELRKCIIPVEDTETFWACRYFHSEVFEPASAGLGYCTTMEIDEEGKVHYECRTEKPSFVPRRKRPLGKEGKI
ncbi:uncharacterized protein LOC122509192 [Leptopilina heterotoma]|uniref:uncharacterized protein LOC122509192 n=1 Tax=Leptopilina heterotoma TaxID=63436 RepID=UPI001CA97C86|nr:uncharacterized protein LOC122509192 [Leptopilina heterotoma]